MNDKNRFEQNSEPMHAGQDGVQKASCTLDQDALEQLRAQTSPLRRELGQQIVEIDPNNLDFATVGRLANMLDELTQSFDQTIQEKIAEPATAAKKILQALVLDAAPADQGIKHLTSLMNVLDRSIEHLLTTGEMSDAPLNKAISEVEIFLSSDPVSSVEEATND